ncbi:MAG: helix-turn-helix transcriptional regulator [Sciscionella sp.]
MDRRPSLEELFTTAQIGRFLGITRAGAHVLTKSGDFPDPIGKLGHYILWWRPDIELWNAQREAGRRRWSVGSLRDLQSDLLRRPSLENVLTMTDVARMLRLGVRGYRVIEATRGGQLPGFPPSLGRLGNYHLWWRPDVEAWEAWSSSGFRVAA